ncbi:MAG: M3 family metallopeptidase [Candidatus Eiseniibacteriota bacterium]|nr:MAG: M3 family metallopeptidase [Candidatus Eisenbacteria bacterium]
MKMIWLLTSSSLLTLTFSLLLCSCMSQESNPFFSESETPFGVPPFDVIKERHYLPAFKEGMAQQQREIEVIVKNTGAPTFENIVEALAASGALLTKVRSVFYHMNSAHTNEQMQKIAEQVAPLLSRHEDDIRLNVELFRRIEAIHARRDSLGLTPEQGMLLEKYYKDFVRGGVQLDEDKKARLREINKELSLLTLKFGKNILKEDNAFELVIQNEEDLTGLPEAVVEAAAEAAAERGKKGKWVFTLHYPSMTPFLRYAENRELREKLFRAYVSRGSNPNKLNTKGLVAEIAALRLEKANLLGYKTYAEFALEENMAKDAAGVYKLLDEIWEPALRTARREAAELQALIQEEGQDFELQPWDWPFYAEKLRKARYDLDDRMLRPYFALESVRDGAFAVANKLYGITFEERTDVPVYQEDVRVFEVKEADGTHIGIFYTDYFPRASKRGGAWMGSCRKQSRQGGVEVTPVVHNVCNFSMPTADSPALLSLEEVRTLFHEFGHALHGLLSNTTYRRLSGSEVATDFVELPSQIMENWAVEPEVLRAYAKHYETGEVIPQELIDSIHNARYFNQGFASVEYLAACYLDMDWHTITAAEKLAVDEFEESCMRRIGLIPQIVVRYRSPYFRHVFSGGYSAGYYSYVWAEVLDTDAFQAFKETSLFDQTTARSFRDNILSTGGTEEPMTLYRRFRGTEPKVDALLKEKGFD